MGIELEWFCLFMANVLGTSIFTRFEVETFWWRLTRKWLVLAGLTYLVYRLAGHWALLVILISAVGGFSFHLWWCRKKGIHPIRATPRRKYYDLRGWEWLE